MDNQDTPNIWDLFRQVEEHPDFIGGTFFVKGDVPWGRRLPDGWEDGCGLSDRLAKAGKRILDMVCVSKETHHVVKTAKASRAWEATRRKVAVLEVDKGLSARAIKFIGIRAKGVHSIVKVWEVPGFKLQTVREEAQALADKLNSPMDQLASVDKHWKNDT